MTHPTGTGTGAGPGGAVVQLRAGGVALLLAVPPDGGQPSVLHWGRDLGDVTDDADDADRLAGLLHRAVPPNAVDLAVPLGLLPEHAHGHRGRPGLTGHRRGRAWSPRWALTSLEQAGARCALRLRDPDAALTVDTELVLEPSGLLRVQHVVTNDGADDYTLHELAVVLPVPARAGELLDLTGRWCRERIPQRHDLSRHGTWLRESRRGRTGHDATLVLVAGVPGFGFRSGEVWAVHLGWSGNHTSYAERGSDGRAVLGVGELLGPGEVVLAPGDRYATPTAYAAWSDAGLDGVSRRFHEWVRARPQHPRSPRPVVLNTWEAVYFDHDLGTLRQLADAAADLGVERFVLDDGWFRHRRDDTAGLGDWYVDETVWPDGLAPVIDHVRARGMEFGLWVEPEMVNPDSDLFRAHPDWVLGLPERLPPPARHQQVLDLVRPEAFAYVLERLDALLGGHAISYLKWDHNRDLVEAAHEGSAAVHGQTLAVYRLLDELRRRHPQVEIESCSSGGGRVDLGILQRTDRVWASDTNDALERQHIQRWTQLLVPPELVGAHVGPPTAHTTGRTQRLSFRAGTALFGHLGLEWDVRGTTPEERAALRGAVSTYKRLRALLHSGDVVRADTPDPASMVHGVVARDRREAVYAVVQAAASRDEVPPSAVLPGLDPATRYRVQVLDVGGPPLTVQRTPPPWAREGAVELPGAALLELGLPVPVLAPEEAMVLHVVAVDDPPATPLRRSGEGPAS